MDQSNTNTLLGLLQNLAPLSTPPGQEATQQVAYFTCAFLTTHASCLPKVMRISIIWGSEWWVNATNVSTGCQTTGLAWHVIG